MSNTIHNVISDEAKRASDLINAFVTFTPRDELQRKWIAIRLADGGSDGTLYDSKQAAVKHQSDEYLCAYVSFRNLIQGTTPREMEVFLRFNRDAYDHGFRLPDPDAKTGGPSALVTTAQADFWNNQLKREFWEKNQELWRRIRNGRW
jgi:hypothetical protein